jgi:hypothetical protein
MARLPLDRAAISTARTKLDTQRAAIDASARKVADAKAALAKAQRSGAPASQIAALKTQVAQLEAAHRTLVAQRGETLAQIRNLSATLLGGRDPGVMVTALEGTFPITLLPVRLETRFLQNPTRLLVRVYPDTVHVLKHADGLTEAERAEGEAYWRARFAKDPQAEGIWRRMVAAHHAPRAMWIVRALQPTNLAQLGQAGVKPVFPTDVDAITTFAKQPFATLLPDRFCAIGYARRADGTRREVFRVWGNNIPDVLPMAPSFDPASATPGDTDFFGGDRKWIVDFPSAVAQGMGIEITQAQVNARLAQLQDATPFTLGALLDRLVVVGVDWTLGPDEGAAAVGAALEAHTATNGLAFVPLGTPTNNTGAGPSGVSSADTATPPPADKPPAGAPGKYDALELLRRALGLPATVLAAADAVPNADLAEQRLMLHMINALWRATLGNYLSLLWNLYGGDTKYVTASTLSLLRSHVVTHLRPAGPLPCLRIDKQPYGILPVIAPSFVQAAPVEKALQSVLGVLRSRWQLASKTAPRLQGLNLDKLAELIQSGPWSAVAKFRIIENPNYSLADGPLADFVETQNELKDRVARELLQAVGIVKDEYPLIQHVIVDPKDHLLAGVPWIQADPLHPKRERNPGEALAPNYIRAIHDALANETQAKNELWKRQNGASLLEAMLAFSAEEEFDKSGLHLLLDAVSAAAAPAGLRAVVSTAPSPFVNVETRVPNDTWFEVGSTREMADVKLPKVTGTATIENFVARNTKQSTPVLARRAPHLAATDLAAGVAAVPIFIRDLSSLRASLAYLAERKVGELDWALRTTLDAFSYRLDAWYTSLASRRLEQLRGTRATGAHLGAYGWVENLKLETRPDSLGYVHAPSLAQGATAAILRSGHLANRERLAGAFNINLTSERTKRALGLLEGVANGQTPAALLGYRFERGLRDAAFGQYILPYRRRYPLRPGNDTATEPAERIAARDVVDGMALATRWRENAKAEVLTGIAVGHQAKVSALLDDLVNTWDAVSDVLTAEGVYQVVQGNLERAGAATAILDNQTRPVDPQVTRTPRMGVSYAQRVAVICASTQLPPEWSGAGPADPRAAAEPRLNAWISAVLGDPKRFEFTARVVRGNTIEAKVLKTGPGQLGLSPLSLVLATRVLAGDQGAQHSPLRERIALSLASQVQGADANTTVVIDERHPEPGKLGLAELEALASILRALIEGARPLTRKDVVALRDEIEATSADQGNYPGVDLADIEARAATAVNALQTYIGALKSAAANAVAARLQEAWPYEAREARSGVDLQRDGETLVSGESTADLAERRNRVLAQLEAKLEAAKALDPAAPAQAGATHAQRVGKALERIRIVFGADFPVLPRFTLGDYASEVAASLADRSALLGGDLLAVGGWLPKLARVREGADRLNAALCAREALVGIGAADDLKLWQLPHRAGAKWAALPAAWKEQDPKKVVPHLALVAHAPKALATIAPADAIAGILCDEWQEFVPAATQTTGISFHYDAPGARAPQSVLLAVPPQLNMENWTLDSLLATVHEAFDLAKLRAVRPKDLTDGMGLFLPANYLPQNFSKDVPSVELWQIAAKYAATLDKLTPLGKA